MTSVRMVRGAVVGPQGRTAAPGEVVEVSPGLAADLVASGKAVYQDGPPAPEPLTSMGEPLTTAPEVVEHRDPKPRGKK